MSDLNFFSFHKYGNDNKAKNNKKIHIMLYLTLLIVITTFIFNTIKIFVLEKDIKYYISNLSEKELESEFTESERLSNNFNLLVKYDEELSEILSKIEKRNNVSEKLLSSIVSTVPKEISFEKILVENNMVIISGSAGNRVCVAELKHELSSLPNFEYVHVNKIVENNSSSLEYSFEIKCLLREVG